MYTPEFELGWFLPSGLRQDILKYEEWLLFSDITIRGEYQAVREYIRYLPKDKPVTFLDLGANVGFASWYFIDTLLRENRKFSGLLVEANSETFNELQRRIKDRESLFGSNVVVPICGLVGRREGQANLRIDGQHTLSRVFEVLEGGVYTPVYYIDLLDYLDDTPIDFIKCDIEGSEWDFVANYKDILKRVGLVIMEIHHVSGDVKVLYQGMVETGLVHHVVIKTSGNVTTECFSRVPLLSSAPDVPMKLPFYRRLFQ